MKEIQDILDVLDGPPGWKADLEAAIQAQVDAAYQRGFDNAAKAAHQSLGGYYTQEQVDEAVRKARPQHCIDLSIGLRYGIQAGGLSVTAESLTKDIERYREQLTTQSKSKEAEQ